MTKTLKGILITINSLAFGGAVLWTIFRFDYEPLITSFVLLAALIGLWLTNSKEEEQEVEFENKNELKNEINITNNVGTSDANSITPKSSSSTKEELDKRKKLTNVLFVDDDTKFKIIKILNVSGWINTKIIKDVKNPDEEIVTNAHIVFVDINDVGIKMGFKDEGLGLAKYLKNKYPEKKVIIYSSDTSGNRFHPALREVDTFLPKNAEPYEFQEIIEQYSAEVVLE